MFFTGIKDYEAAKSLYKKLCFENHPDKGGNVETMQQINAEWEKLVKEGFEVECELTIKLNFAIDLNLEVELCGTWIWVGGDTRPAKDKLKEAGFFWAPKKKLWYWREESGKKRWNKSTKSIEEIRDTYGSKKYKKERRVIAS
jgi:hypothetical protein